MSEQSQQRLKSLSITGLRRLKNLNISFEDKEVTGIFGVNGCGKTTLLYTLLCLYNQKNPVAQFNFGIFFKKCSANEFEDTEITADISYRIGRDIHEPTVSYKKSAGSDRWTPKTSRRPERKVYFLGISSSVPSIENERETTVNYRFDGDNDLENGILGLARRILGIQYTQISRTRRNNKDYYHATVQDGANYFSISMGAGEQRVLRLLEVIEKVENYSLVVIDEIDLTLHNAALMRLIDYLVEKGRSRHIQFIFSSHCEALTKRKDINVRHLFQTPVKTLCFNESNPECLESMTGEILRPVEIYVEDILAKTIVAHVAKELGISKRVVIKQYGSCTNAFVASCGMHMLGHSLEHKLFVLDGDLYRTEEECKNQLKKFYSGTEPDKEQKRNEVLQHILQLNLPDGEQPEKYINHILTNEIKNQNSEIVALAKSIIEPDDPHKYLDDIIDGLGDEENVGLYKIIEELAKHPEWNVYTASVRNWLQNEKNKLGL